MPPRKLPRHLVWLESFAAAVEAGSLEGAAEHLGVARSVVSEHIRALEDALGGRRSPCWSAGPAAASSSPRAASGSTRAPRRRCTSWTSSGCGTSPAPSPACAWASTPPSPLSLLRRHRPGRRARPASSWRWASAAPYELVRQVQTRQLDLVAGLHPAAAPPGRGGRVPAAPALRGARRPGERAGRDATPPARALHVKDLEGQPFVDWLRDDPYGGANSARFAAHGVTVREVARVRELPPPLRSAARLPRLRHRPRPAAPAALPRRPPRLAPAGGGAPGRRGRRPVALRRARAPRRASRPRRAASAARAKRRKTE